MSQNKIYTQLITFPGVPIEVASNAIGLLMNVHGIGHQIPVNPELVTGESLVTGNADNDARISNQYIELNSFMSDLSRDFSQVNCDTKSDNVNLHLTFTCL